jgi:hypothetical protein
MFVAFPVSSPEWFFAEHLGALLIARHGIIITSTERIAAAAVAC